MSSQSPEPFAAVDTHDWHALFMRLYDDVSKAERISPEEVEALLDAE